MKVLKKIINVFDKRQKAGIVFLLVIIAIGALLEMVGVSMILPFVNAIMDPAYIKKNPIAFFFYRSLGLSTDTQFFILLGLLLIILYILKNLFIVLMTKMQYQYMYKYQRELAVKMLSCYLRQPYSYHLRHGSTEMIRNINNDVQCFFAVVISGLQIITELCVCLALFAYLFYKDKSITLGITAVMVIFMCAYILFIKGKVSHMGDETRKHLNNINQGIVQSFSGIKEVKILNRERFFVNTFKKEYKAYANYQTWYFIYGLLPRPLMEAVCISAMLAIIILKLLNGTVAAYFVPTISVFAFGAFRMMPSFSRITNALNNIIFNLPSVNPIYEEIKNMDELMRHMEQETASAKPLPFEQEIRIRDLNFSYPDAARDVLRDVNIIIPKNKSVAFIGPSGEGKTTLADIVLGLHKANKGAVYVDGTDIRENIAVWHQKLGYIPQNIYLIDDSIRNNIVFGLPPEESDERQLWKALADAQLKEFVEALEQGLDTPVGEQGIRLSGGQRQRIGIARALYNNPEVLILDEATSALDNDTEKAVMEAIEHLAGQKTLIIIAHRLSTIENCDLIYEVNGGSVKLSRKKETE